MNKEPRFFDDADQVVSDLMDKDRMVKAYENHLKKMRMFAWVALILAFLLGLWWSENGRYVVIGTSTDHFDTKTGNYYYYNSDTKKFDKL